MKILLDENIPVKVITDFGKGFQVKTVQGMGWFGKKNGELLGLMTFNGFDMFITMDRNLKHQQNLEKFDLTIFLLLAKNNKHQTIQPFIGKVRRLLKSGNYRKFNEIRG